MSYDDTPYYVKNAEPIQKPQRDTFKPLGYPTASQPSPNYIWYMEEDRKRRAGLKNEIDINEICAAARGVRNKWLERVLKHPKEFQPVIDGKDFDWNRIVSIKA